jgi:hypothetical protein
MPFSGHCNHGLYEIAIFGGFCYNLINMKLYRFSPIQNEAQLKQAVVYVATETPELAKKIIGRRLPISSLTIFSHYPEEFENLQKIILSLGKLYNKNNGPRVTLREPIKVGDNMIQYLRVRKPDSYRMQVGCCDFEVEDYVDFEKQYLSKHGQNLRLIDRPDYQMIEFFDPDFDVLAYVVSNNLIKD